MRHSTTSYPLETPDELWETFKTGPAAVHDRLNDRLVATLALDTLQHYDPEDLPPPTRELAIDIVQDSPGLSIPEEYAPLIGGD